MDQNGVKSWNLYWLGSNYSVSIRNPFVSTSFWPFLGRKDHLMHFLTFLTTFEVPYRAERGEKLKFLLAKPFCLGSNYSVSMRNPFVSTSFWPYQSLKSFFKVFDHFWGPVTARSGKKFDNFFFQSKFFWIKVLRINSKPVRISLLLADTAISTA